MSDYIYHHGIKGQKWGVRRYQNPDGTLTSMGKARKRAIDVNRNMDAVNDIVKTMSRKDKELLNLDIIGDEKGVAISIGTRAGSEYRNKGYCSRVARKDNAGSIKIAEKSGFKLDEASVLPDDPWIKYQYK